MTQYVARELLTVPTMSVEIIVRTNVIITASVVDKEAIYNKKKIVAQKVPINFCTGLHELVR